MTQTTTNQPWPTGYINWANSKAEEMDTLFNRVNTVPIVGSFTSSIYATASVVHFLAAGFISIIGFMGQLKDGKDSNWKLVVDASKEHMKHALLNYGSALVIGSLAGSIFGWMPLLSYHISQLEDTSKSWIKPKQEGFKPFLNYSAPISDQFEGYKAKIKKSLDPRNLVSLVRSIV